MISTLFSSLQETETLLSFWRFVFLQCTDHISFSSCYSIACSLFCISAFGIMHSEATVFRSLGWDPHASHLGMLLLLFFFFFFFLFFFLHQGDCTLSRLPNKAKAKRLIGDAVKLSNKKLVMELHGNGIRNISGSF